MNHQTNAVPHPLVTQCPIPPSDLPGEDFSRDYKNINFLNLAWGFSSEVGDDRHNNCFVHPQKGIMFRGYVGRQLMTGNELLYYPELAKKLLEIEDLPILKRYYEVDKTINNLEFFDYFNQHVKACHKDFEAELNNASIQINQLIDDYGQKRFTPIISNKYHYQSLIVIHDIEWSLDRFKRDPTWRIDLHRLFSFPKKIIRAHIEEVMPETPFVAVRIIKKRAHIGYVQWYSLDTCQPVSKREISRWKKSL